MRRSLSAMAIFALTVLCLFSLPTISATNNKSASKQITFSKNVAPILFKNCAGCHRPNDIAPFVEEQIQPRSDKGPAVGRADLRRDAGGLR